MIAEVLLIVYGLICIGISIWNAYASGYDWTLLKYCKEENWLIKFFKITTIGGIILAFAGASYGTALLLGYLLFKLGYIDIGTLETLYAIKFLILGGLIVASGFLVTAESILLAYYRRKIWDILVAIWNTFASIWNTFVYVKDFLSALEIVRGSSRESKEKAFMLLVIAALIGIILTYVAFKMGEKQAKKLFTEVRVIRI